MKEIGLISDIVIYNIFIDGYGKFGLLSEVINIYEVMKRVGCDLDVIIYNVFINCFCKCEKLF